MVVFTLTLSLSIEYIIFDHLRHHGGVRQSSCSEVSIPQDTVSSLAGTNVCETFEIINNFFHKCFYKSHFH